MLEEPVKGLTGKNCQNSMETNLPALDVWLGLCRSNFCHFLQYKLLVRCG